ncbi:MAG: universal stress protein [Chloroflexota bacterium]|nr:universal stress protein [Chloroflexota bacterium]
MFKHILAPLDGSLLAECALPHVVTLAKTFAARVTLLRVLECPLSADQDKPVDLMDWQMGKSEAQAYLDTLVNRLQTVGLSVDAVLLEGQPASCVIHFIHQSDVDLIVLSSHGASGLSAWNVSSVAQKILLRAHRSVVLVRADPSSTADLAGLRYTRLLVPLDGSQQAECVLPVASVLAQSHHALTTVAHVVQKPEMPYRAPRRADDIALADHLTARNHQEAVAYMEQVQRQLSGDVQTRILASEDVAFSLHDLAETEHVDLVVMSAHGFSGKQRWPYGSMTTSFILYGSTSLFAVQDLSPADWGLTQREIVVQEKPGH